MANELQFIDMTHPHQPLRMRYLPPQRPIYPHPVWNLSEVGKTRQVIDAQFRQVRGRWQRSIPGAIGLAVIAVVLDVLLWRSVTRPSDWMLLYLTGGPTFTFFAACWGFGARWASRVLFGAFLAVLAYLAWS